MIYLPLAVWSYVTCGDLPMDAFRSYMRGLLFIGEHYNSWMLWYLLSTIYSMAMIWALLRRKVPMETILAVSVVVFMLSSVLDWVSNYSGPDPVIGAVDTFLGYTFNNGRIFRGMLYIVMGMCLAYRHPRLVTGVFMAVIGFIASCMGAGGIISCIICSIGLLCVTVDIRLPDSPVYGVMRTMSTGVYFVHLWVWTVCYMVMFGEKTEGLTMFVLVLSISMALSLVYALLKPHLGSSALRLRFTSAR